MNTLEINNKFLTKSQICQLGILENQEIQVIWKILEIRGNSGNFGGWGPKIGSGAIRPRMCVLYGQV